MCRPQLLARPAEPFQRSHAQLGSISLVVPDYLALREGCLRDYVLALEAVR